MWTIELSEIYEMVCEGYKINYLGCCKNVYYFKFCGTHITHNIKLSPSGILCITKTNPSVESNSK